jgi:hypothetical protein
MISIMSPYYLPFLGYFQLIAKVNTFIIFDDIKFQKSGFSISNKIKNNKIKIYISERNKSCLINNKFLSNKMLDYKIKLKKNLQLNYKEFNNEIFNELFFIPKNFSYFDFLFRQINFICKILDIKTKILISSRICDTSHLKAEEKIFMLCKTINDSDYVNPAGGMKLYENKRDLFEMKNIKLNYFNYYPFIKKIKKNSIEMIKDDLSILHLLFTYTLSEIKSSL